MSTYKRGRSNKLETNLTASFIAGGFQYTHHPGSLAASYRFEEPYFTNTSTSASLEIKDSSGSGLHGLVITGTLASSSADSEKFLAERRAKSSPYYFSKNTMPSSRFPETSRVTSPISISGEQIRVLHFSTGTSERVEFPSGLGDKINSIHKPTLASADSMFDQGVTFAFWIRPDGDDNTFIMTPSLEKFELPHKARTIFSANRSSLSGGGYELFGDEIEPGAAISIRIINDPGKPNHGRLSIVSAHAGHDGPYTVQFEWMTDARLPKQVWTHVCVIYPIATGINNAYLSGIEIRPKAYINGVHTNLEVVPVDVKFLHELSILYVSSSEGIFNNIHNRNPATYSPYQYYADIYIESPSGKSSLSSSLIRLTTALASSSVIDLYQSATLRLSSGFDNTNNHLSTFTLKDTQGKTANFSLDFYHTGSIVAGLNGNATNLSPQMVNPDPSKLATVEINYNPDADTKTTYLKPSNGSFIRLTSPNNATRIYKFDSSASNLVSTSSATGNALNGPQTYDYTTIRPSSGNYSPLGYIRIYATGSEDDSPAAPYVQFSYNGGSSSPSSSSSTQYLIGMNSVPSGDAGKKIHARRIYDAIELAVANGHLDISIGKINSTTPSVSTLRTETRSGVDSSGVVALYRRNTGTLDPSQPDNFGYGIVYFYNNDPTYKTLDINFGGGFAMGYNHFSNSAVYNSSSLSYGFVTGSGVLLDSLLAQMSVHNYTGIPILNKIKRETDVSCVDGRKIQIMPAGTPIFVFGDGDSIVDTSTNQEGTSFASNRYIGTNTKFSSACLVKFSAIPARSTGSLVDQVSTKLRNSPESSSHGLHVQYSYDGLNWNGTGTQIREGRDSTGSIAYAHLKTANNIDKVRLTRPLTGGSFEKIILSDYDSSSEWRHFSFFVDGFDAADRPFFIRIVQEGYARSFSDNWAIANLSIEGKMSRNVVPQTASLDYVNLVPIDNSLSTTWSQFATIVNSSLGHNGEILATHDSNSSTVSLKMQSPVGIIEDGVSAGTRLTGSVAWYDENSTNRGFASAFSNQEKIKLINFDGGGSSKRDNTHIRIGLKDVIPSGSSAVIERVKQVISGSRHTYAESKILGRDLTNEATVRSEFLGGTSYPIMGTYRTDGTNSTGWSWSGFSNNTAAKSIGCYGLEGPFDKYAENVASRIHDVVYENTGTFGVKVITTASLGHGWSVLFEHLNNGSLASTARVKLFNVSATSSYSDVFGSGHYGVRHPRGDIATIGTCSLGTNMIKLRYGLDYGLPVWPYRFIPRTHSYTNLDNAKIAGTTPKCMLDDVAVWTRCLSQREIKAIFESRRGTYEPISGISSHSQRIQLRDADNEPGAYPTNSRITDEDFTGRFKTNFDSSSEIDSPTSFASAFLTLLEVPQSKSWISLTDWAGVTKSFMFVASNEQVPAGYEKVLLGNEKIGARNAWQPKKMSPAPLKNNSPVPGKEKLILETLRNLIEKNNSLVQSENFGIFASLNGDNSVNFKQSKALESGNTAIQKSIFFKKISIISEGFTGGKSSIAVEFPHKLTVDHPLIHRLISPGHALPTLHVVAKADKSQNFVSLTDSHGEQITPYKEDGQFSAFGVQLHDDVDTRYTSTQALGAAGDFWAQGSSITQTLLGKSGPTWAKHKIEIDLSPAQKTKLFKHTTYGSTMAYFNFSGSNWEPVGTVHTGSFRTSAQGVKISASCRLIVDNGSYASSIGYAGVLPFDEISYLSGVSLFSLTDSYGRKVRFFGADSSDVSAEISGNTFIRYSSTKYGIILDGLTAAAFVSTVESAVLAALLLGDLNINPVIISNDGSGAHIIEFRQIDFGEEGNTQVLDQSSNVDFANQGSGAGAGRFIGSHLGIFSSSQTTFDPSLITNTFAGGQRHREPTSSQFADSKLYSLEGTSEDPRTTSFRRWIDSVMVGFGPSIGIKAEKSTNATADVRALRDGAVFEGKYALLDGGLSNPVTTFGFPYHPKFHATSSQTFNVSTVIDRPFLVEKMVYEFKANVYESASIQTFYGGNTTVSTSYGPANSYLQPAYINIPTPTFFILNQRKCNFPEIIENELNVVSIADSSGSANFAYTASIPSNFYLTSMSSSPGVATRVDTTRDLLTFSRFSMVPNTFENDDFEDFVDDVRETIDLVLIPSSSRAGLNNSTLTLEGEDGKSLVLASTIRSPKLSSRCSSFKTEGDFFGSSKSIYHFSIPSGTISKTFTFPLGEPALDPFVLEDAAGVVRRFIVSRGIPPYVNFVMTDFSSYPNFEDKTIILTDYEGRVVTFALRDDIENSSKESSSNYNVTIKGYTTDPELAQLISEGINLANDTGDISIRATAGSGGSLSLSQVDGGVSGETSIGGTIGAPYAFGGGVELPFNVPTYFGVGLGVSSPITSAISGETIVENIWKIPCTKALTHIKNPESVLMSIIYAGLARAFSTDFAAGGFKSPPILDSTGSVPTNSLTFSQRIGGQESAKRIFEFSNFNDPTLIAPGYLGVGFLWPGEPFNIFVTATLEQAGEIQKDTLTLGWRGNRTGIPEMLSGRSPFGGENGAVSPSYTSRDGTGVCTVEHSPLDATDSPYLLVPGDKLVFGWQSPIGTGSHLYHSASVSNETSGSFEILPGAGKLVLYGSILQNDAEKTHITSNQPLTSESVHEAIFSDADIYDVYDTDPFVFHYNNTLDRFVDGSINMAARPPVFTRQVISLATEGGHSVGPRNNSYPIFSKRAGFFRGRRSFDEKEVVFDSMVPSIDELIRKDDARALSPSYNDGSSRYKESVLVLAHPSVAQTTGTYDNGLGTWGKWMASFPFEGRYAGASRTFGFKTAGISAKAVTGSIDVGQKRITHVWLANASGPIKGYRDSSASQERYKNTLSGIIEKPRLFADSSANEVSSRPQPFNMAYSILTSESGEGAANTSLTRLNFESGILGTRISDENKDFFSRLFFGSGEGIYKFPKLPYWKNVYVEPGQGFDINETFPVTRGAIIRGFRYGLSNVVPVKSSAVFRRDRYGHFRDMLEQRPLTIFYVNDGVIPDTAPVVVTFRSATDSNVVNPSATSSANLSLLCTSSVPYVDGTIRDRT